MTTEKDYSLLRPFDLEAAKAGALLCDKSGRNGWEYAAGPDSSGRIAATYSESGDFILPTRTDEFRMAPLCWVEWKPVYKGDVLYWKPQPASACIVENVMDSGWLAFRASENEPCGVVHPDGLTWTPPKVKREGWVNVYPNNSVFMRSSKDDADNCATNERIACVRIEWEEPAGGAA